MIVYLVEAGAAAALLWQARSIGLLPLPQSGTDQLSMLLAAGKLAEYGMLPGSDYHYSSFYTAFLTLLWLVTGGIPVAMRLVQGVVCAAVVPLIYQTVRLMRGGKNAARLAAVLYMFYAPALLISLDFLRAAPLGLLFLSALYALFRALRSRRRAAVWFGVSGLAAGLTVLGRETFAPVVLAAAVLLPLFPAFRRRISARNYALWLAAAALPALTMMTVNELRFGSFQPVPGNTGVILKVFFGESSPADPVVWKNLLAGLGGNLAGYLSNYELPNSLSVYAHADLLPSLRVAALPFNLLLILAMVGAWKARRRPEILLAGLLAAAFFAAHLPFTPFYRFRIPVTPLLAALAGIALARLASDFRKRRKNFAGTLLIILLFLGCTATPPAARRTVEERLTAVRLLLALDRPVAAGELLEEIRSGPRNADPPLIRLVKKSYSSLTSDRRELY